MRKKILVISVGIWPPAVKMAGTAAIYNLLKLLAQKGIFEIHILTALPSWSDSNTDQWAKRQKVEYGLTFHFVKAENLFWTRILLFLKAVELCRRFNFALIHEYSGAPALVGLTGILGRIGHCRTVHTLCVTNDDWWRALFPSPFKRYAGRSLNKIIITSPKLEMGFRSGRVVYLPLGIDVDKFSTTKIGSVRSSILFLGPLTERKGAFVLLKAVRDVVEKNPQVKFVFATYGREVRDPNYRINKKRFGRIAAGFRENVELLGGLQDVPRLMAGVGIFVLPATSLYGTLSPPLTLLEAMGSGKACVVSDVCRGDGLVEDEVNCLLFRSGDAEDLAAKIDLLLGDKALRKKLATNARQKVVKEFDINKVAEKLLELYKEILP